MRTERAAELLERMSGRTLVILGDLMLDRYIWGDVARISPEAPVPVVAARRTSDRLGGSANVAANAVALGARARPVGVVGDDLEGVRLRESLEESGVDASGLQVDPARPTTRKTRVIARAQQMIRLDVEETAPLPATVRAGLQARLESALDGADALVVSDYGKGVIDADTLGGALAAAQSRGVPVSVDPKESHFDAYRSVAVITPNLAEAGLAVGRQLATDADVDAAGAELRRRLGADSVLITRGERGMSLYHEGPALHVPTAATEVYDVTGAGDTVVTVFALARCAGADYAEAAELATHAASLVIRDVGTAVAGPEAILESLRGSS